MTHPAATAFAGRVAAALPPARDRVATFSALSPTDPAALPAMGAADLTDLPAGPVITPVALALAGAVAAARAGPAASVDRLPAAPVGLSGRMTL